MLTAQNKENLERLDKIMKATPHIIKNYFVKLGNEALENGFNLITSPKVKEAIKDFFDTDKKINENNPDK